MNSTEFDEEYDLDRSLRLALVQAGTCPFTGSTYEYCERCEVMIPIQVAV